MSNLDKKVTELVELETSENIDVIQVVDVSAPTGTRSKKQTKQNFLKELWSNFDNFYTKTQSDNRYLQSFTEQDPIFTAWLETNPINLTSVKSKSFVITNPTAGMTYALWKAPANITITSINAVQIGGTNLVGILTECDANGLNPVAVDSTDMTITTSNVSKTSFSNPSIDSGDWIGWKNTNVSGAVSRLMVTFNYQ